MNVSIDSAVTTRWPGFVATILIARGLRNGPPGPESREALGAAAAAARADMPPEAGPHIASWREAYQSFGAKPQRFLSSVEALRKRAVTEAGLPSINELVDHYNALSVRFGLPVGGEDLDRYRGDAVLRLATGVEPFETTRDGAPVVEHPEPGEVVWTDELGVTCRRWNWRQCTRTRLTEHTTNVFFVLERLPPYPMTLVDQAADALVSALMRAAPAVSWTTVRLTA